MGIEFFGDNEGRVILGVRGGPNNYLIRRKSLYHVQANELEKFAQKYSLSSFRRARVALDLNEIRTKYNLMDAVDSYPADTSIARWIGGINKSIGRIADAVKQDPNKFRLAIEAIEAPASNWARMQDKTILEKMGIDVHSEQGIYYELYQFTRHWFLYAELLRAFSEDARRNLKARNRSHGLKGSKGLIADAPGKETYLYGGWLPKLYERIMGARFGISKDSDGQKIKKTTGVAFVIDVASVIGLNPTPSNVADHFNKAKRYAKTQFESGRVVPSSK